MILPANRMVWVFVDFFNSAGWSVAFSGYFFVRVFLFIVV